MKLNRCGFITNYLVSGPRETDFENCNRDNNQLRYEQYLRTIVADPCSDHPAGEIKLGAPGSLSLPWEYYYSYGNWFVDKSSFYSTLKKVELDAVTELLAEDKMTVTAVFWSYAAITVWCNGTVVCETAHPVYKPIQKQQAVLKLNKGLNQIYVRLQTLGVRDTKTLFGIQLSGDTGTVQVRLPDPAKTEALYRTEQWLGGIRLADNMLLFPEPAPAGSRLGYNNKSPDYADKDRRITWESVAGKKTVRLDQTKKGILHVTAGNEAGMLTRSLENILAQTPAYTGLSNADENRQLIFSRIAETTSLSRGDKFGFSIANILARKALGKDTPQDPELLAETLDQIEKRYDCSDFLLCGLIRYLKNYPLPAGLAARTRAVLVNYRYWMDQQGTDAMCFWSENHALMFYSGAMIAGELYPDEYFPRAEKTGRELSAEGRERVLCWLADVEEYGFEEFLSTVYMCVTFAALLNVIDFSEPEISRRAARVTDTLLGMLARHTFDGVVLGPMGRVYREVIHPFKQGAQALMNLIDPTVPYSYGEGWLGFYATSGYQLPGNLTALMQQPVYEYYSTGNARICLNKQAEYILTSVQSPRTDPDFRRWENLTLKADARPGSCAYTKSLNERFHGTTCFEPGVYGYQQHLWYAALDCETDVFTNHPGGTCEDSSMRPGFWYGNGVIPAIRQEENRIGIVYRIPDDHPIHFTHAYFPAAKFTETVITDHWLFGRKKEGFLALWCSAAMEAASDWLFGCEYRSYGDQVAYYCICEKAGRFSGMDAFIKAVKAAPPVFEPVSGSLTAGNMTVVFTESDDQTQYI